MSTLHTALIRVWYMSITYSLDQSMIHVYITYSSDQSMIHVYYIQLWSEYDTCLYYIWVRSECGTCLHSYITYSHSRPPVVYLYCFYDKNDCIVKNSISLGKAPCWILPELFISSGWVSEWVKQSVSQSINKSVSQLVNSQFPQCLRRMAKNNYIGRSDHGLKFLAVRGNTDIRAPT